MITDRLTQTVFSEWDRTNEYHLRELLARDFDLMLDLCTQYRELADAQELTAKRSIQAGFRLRSIADRIVELMLYD